MYGWQFRPSASRSHSILGVMKSVDHVVYNVAFTRNEIDQAFGFHPVNLIEAMRPRWKARTTSHYPGDPPYDHNKFRAHYSDHDPVQFRMAPLAGGDDD